MLKQIRWLAVIGLCVGLLGTTAWAKERKAEGKHKHGAAKVDQVPELAKARILNEAGRNKVLKIEAEKEDGKVFYEGEWVADGRKIEVKVTADGRLVEKETAIPLSAVPAAARKTIVKVAGKAKIKEVERVVAGKETFYEAEWAADGKEIEVKVAPNGKLLAKEVEDADDDDDDDDDDDGEDEEEVSLDEVPKAVRATILKAAGRNKITEIEKETRGKKVVYEAEWKAGGKEIEIKIAPDGKILSKKAGDDDADDDEDDDDGEDEEEVSLDDVPRAVRATILKAAGRSKITEIEKETRGGKVVYEAEWKAGGKEIEIKIAPNGKILSKEVEDADDDEDDD